MVLFGCTCIILFVLVMHTGLIRANFTTQTCTFRGKTYRTILPPDIGKSGRTIILCTANLATSADDLTNFGDLYKWGRAADGHQLRFSQQITSREPTTTTPNRANFIGIGGKVGWTTATVRHNDRSRAWANGGGRFDRSYL